MWTLEKIKARQIEINQRMAAIKAEAGNSETLNERLMELETEVDTLLQERATLSRKALEIRAEAESSFAPAITEPTQQRAESDPNEDYYSTLAYRKAFKNYVQRGITSLDLIHPNKREDASTTMSDIKSVIVPTVITDKLFERKTNAGSLFDRVTKTSYPSGVSFKTTNFKPELEWVAENGKPDRKKATTGEIVFNAYKGQIRIAISLEAKTTSLEAFEAAILERLLNGCRRGFDKVITVGTGSGQPKGFITDAAYTTAKSYKMNNKTVSDYSEWIKAYSKVPLAYQSTVNLVINNTDWQAKVVGMKDDNGRVVAFDTIGFGGAITHMFMGREVVVLEDQGLKTFDSITGAATASAATAFAAFVDLADYNFNSNMALTVRKYIDEDTDEEVTKATIIADGKMVDKASLVPICRDIDAT